MRVMTGVENIVKMIDDKTTEKEHEIISEAEKYKRLKLEEAKKRAEENAKKITNKAEIEVRAELARYKASAKLKAKYRLLDAKEKLVKSVLDSVRSDLEKVVGKAEYKDILTGLVIDGATALGVDQVELVLPKGHFKKLDLEKARAEVAKHSGIKIKIVESKDTVRSIGGVIVRTKDGPRWIDNTFEARLERMETQIRDTISSTLFKKE
ncbi:MAG: hypothetical protein DRO87_04870 [Candidatus Thorarchaeota archaeon]|nr:MAG: hypothetical protein DRO87_04870 [Candidatus Thorarchaeota archaeon]